MTCYLQAINLSALAAFSGISRFSRCPVPCSAFTCGTRVHVCATVEVFEVFVCTLQLKTDINWNVQVTLNASCVILVSLNRRNTGQQ